MTQWNGKNEVPFHSFYVRECVCTSLSSVSAKFENPAKARMA